MYFSPLAFSSAICSWKIKEFHHVLHVNLSTNNIALLCSPWQLLKGVDWIHFLGIKSGMIITRLIKTILFWVASNSACFLSYSKECGMKKQIKLWLVFHFSLYVILLAPKAFKKFISYHFSILSCNLYVSGQDIHLEDLLQLYFFPIRPCNIGWKLRNC